MGAQSESGSPAERAMLSIMAELAADGESIAIGDDQTCRGDDPACRGGVYVLRLAAGAPLLVRFGRYAGGRAIAVPAGECLYVGSALGARGAVALAGRLLRHATRTWPPPASSPPCRPARRCAGTSTTCSTRPPWPSPASWPYARWRGWKERWSSGCWPSRASSR